MPNIQITGRHLEISEAIRSYVEKKLHKVEHHFDQITQVHVVLGVEKNEHTAEATLHASGHIDLFAEAKEDNLYAAIDALYEKLNRQVIKHKEKLQGL